MGNRTRKIAEILGSANHSTGKLASDNVDVSFENITDTGTEGTKIATGTTAQRGSTTGQLRFNSDTGLAEYYDGSAFKSLDAPPIVSSISPTSLGESVLGSSQTIVITGSNFSSTVTAKIVGNDLTEYTPDSTTRDSNTQVTITTPTNLTTSNEPYDIVINNISGLSGTLADALSINDTPVFSTASGSLGTLQNADRSASNLTAISFSDEESTPTVSVTSGSIPTGLTLNSNGTWSGTANAEVSDQTYNFTVTATDGSESATRNYSITVNAPVPMTYLIVAGGGGGGSSGQDHTAGGGGGAGGYRNSYASETSGGNSATETGITLQSGTYTITVGGGGSGGAAGSAGSVWNQGNNGSNSSIAHSGITTITSSGGGGGGTYNHNGLSGGSGGGGGAFNTRSGGSGTSGQGFVGQNTGSQAQDTSQIAGGGGGASEAGGTDGDGQGGDGLSSSITGSSVTRAGGGGGAGNVSTNGGAGGGANGKNSGSSGNGSTGSTNTGGGGSGAYTGNQAGSHAGGNGGSGVVILRLLTADYSGTTTGSPTVETDGDYKVLTYTGSGTYVH